MNKKDSKMFDQVYLNTLKIDELYNLYGSNKYSKKQQIIITAALDTKLKVIKQLHIIIHIYIYLSLYIYLYIYIWELGSMFVWNESTKKRYVEIWEFK